MRLVDILSPSLIIVSPNSMVIDVGPIIVNVSVDVIVIVVISVRNTIVVIVIVI